VQALQNKPAKPYEKSPGTKFLPASSDAKNPSDIIGRDASAIAVLAKIANGDSTLLNVLLIDLCTAYRK